MSIKIRTAGNRVIVLAAGALASLVLLEVGLQIFGAMQEDRSGARRTHGVSENTVLCVGDSFTYGIGAPADKSYPRQLEALLNERTGKKWTVVNLGQPANNSTQIFESLRESIDRIRPRVVVMLGGSANIWNYKGYRTFKHAGSRLYDYLYDLRTFRLIQVLMFNKHENILLQPSVTAVKYNDGAVWDEYSKRGSVYRDGAQYEMAISSFKEGIRVFPEHDANYWNLIELYQELGRAHDAEKYYQRATKLKKLSSWGYAMLGNYCKSCGRLTEALHYYEQGVLQDPYSQANANMGGLKILYGSINPDIRNNVMLFVRTLRNKYGLHNPFVDSVIKNEKMMFKSINQWIDFDMGRMIELCRKRGVPAVVQNYPRDANYIYRTIASAHAAAFVDNYNRFEILADQTPGVEYFVPDGHCSALGYGIMAENVYAVMKEMRLVEKTEGYDRH